MEFDTATQSDLETGTVAAPVGAHYTPPTPTAVVPPPAVPVAVSPVVPQTASMPATTTTAHPPIQQRVAQHPPVASQPPDLLDSEPKKPTAPTEDEFEDLD
jgi:hypothetical protein